MNLLVEFYIWWKNKFTDAGAIGKVVFILVNLFVFALLASFPIVWSLPDPKTKQATHNWSEINQRINDWNSRLDELDLELYAELATADTANPQPYQEISKKSNDLDIDSRRLEQYKASFAGDVIGHESFGQVTFTKEYQVYLDQEKSNKDQRLQLEEKKREVARARGGLVHMPQIDSLWNERLTITAKIEAEQPLLEAAAQTEKAARRTPWGTVKLIYDLIGLGFLILIGLGIFIAVTERR